MGRNGFAPGRRAMAEPRPPTRRQAQAAARRAELLRTAFAKFASQGYRKTSVRDIAHALGVNEGLLYHYFASKADLFAAVLAEYAPLSLRGPVIDEPPETPIAEVLRAQGRRFLALLQERRALVATMLAEAPSDPELGGILGTFLRETGEGVAGFLRERLRAGEIASGASVDAAAQAYVGGLVFHFLSRTLFASAGGPMPADPNVVDDLVRVLLDGLLHDPT